MATALIGAFSSAASAQQASDPQPTTCRQSKDCPAVAESCKQQRKAPQPPRTKHYMLM